MTAPSHSIKATFRNQPCEITGYIEPADRSVGIMGESFIVEKIILPDGTEPDYDSISDDEYAEIEKQFFDAHDAWENEQRNQHGGSDEE